MTLDGIVLDLDDTLYDTSRLLLPWADRRAVAALRDSGLDIGEDDALAQLAELRSQGVWSFAPLVESRGGAGELIATAERAWFSYDPPPMALDESVRAALDELAALAPLALLTSGDPPTQEKKVARLGIAPRFAAIAYVPRTADGGKTAALAALLAARRWEPRRAVVCGDRPDADIRAANRNGCRGVLVRSAGSEFAAAKPQEADDVPWRTISSVVELPALLRRE